MQDSLLSLPNLLTFTKLVQTKSQNKQLCPDQHPGNHTETEVFTVFEVGIFFWGGVQVWQTSVAVALDVYLEDHSS